MVTVKPIENVTLSKVKAVTKPIFNRDLGKTEDIITNNVRQFFEPVDVRVSTFLQEFNKTAYDENYFQFKIDPDTGKHYEPDMFQKASGMNLYIGNDVLVTAPTGTGKTAIAEYIITKNLKDGYKTFYTTPLKALSNEKFREFCGIYGEDNVGLLTGDTKVNSEAPVIIMTTEVYRNMAASGRFNFDRNSSKGLSENLKTVIFDELQYLGDIDRGGIWEQSIMFTPQNVQILSLSATIGNNEEINNWIASIKGRKSINVTPKKNYIPEQAMDKETVLINVPAENRHVPLSFMPTSIDADIIVPARRTAKKDRRAGSLADLKSQSIFAKPTQSAYKYLTQDLSSENKLPAIYFIFSKKEGRNLLKYLAEEGTDLNDFSEKTKIRTILDKYKNDDVYLGESLNVGALYKGYAIHNAGMLPSQKQLIEELFQQKLIKVVIATETLSAGINMPARTTVISTPRKPASTGDSIIDKRRNLTPNEFHQMAGRAGRRGIDVQGYCYPLSCNLEQTKFYNDIIRTSANPLKSNLDIDYSFIANYASEFTDETELENTLAKSLYVHTAEGRIDIDKLQNLMERYSIRKEILIDNNYIDENGKLMVKGKMLKALNGYEQIPILNFIEKVDSEHISLPQLAGVIGGLANIKYEPDPEAPPTAYMDENPCGIYDMSYIEDFSDAVDELKKHEREIYTLYPERILCMDKNIADHVYKWLQLNSVNENGRENWHDLYRGELQNTIKDEGSLFKEISTAADLMKQLCEACKIGIKESETIEEKKHYQRLLDKLSESLKLMKREPVNEIRF